MAAADFKSLDAPVEGRLSVSAPGHGKLSELL